MEAVGGEGQGCRLYKGVSQKFVWVCSQLAGWERPPALKKGQHFVLVGFGMEAEIDAEAPWRKDQGQGEVARSRREFECSSCETHSLQPEWDQLSNLVHKVCGKNEQKVY